MALATLVETLAAGLVECFSGYKDSEENELTVEALTNALNAILGTPAEAPPAKKKAPKAAPKKATQKATKSKSDEVNITLVLNYGPKSHALFGDTASIKDDLTKYNKENGKLFSYNGKLTYGDEKVPGWTIMDKEKLDDAKTFLEELGVNLTEEEKAKKGGKKTEKAKPEKSTKKTEAPTKTKTNQWGNQEDEELGFVYYDLPIGAKGARAKVVIGKQDADSTETKLKSVLPLDDDDLELCKQKKMRCLTEEMLTKLGKDAKLKTIHKQLTEIMERKLVVEEDEEVEEDAEEEEADGDEEEAEAEEEEAEAEDE